MTKIRIAALSMFIAAVMLGTSAHATDPYPVKPVRLIVPYVAGGNADIQARYIAERLSEALGKQFIVDNRGGANGMIGLELAARAAADGYTLVFVANTYTVSPSLFARVPYDTVRDFQPISLVGDTPELFIGTNALAANSVKEVIALAKSRPGQLNYGSTGNGSPSHLAGALFELMTGTKLVHVPYKGMAASNLGVMTGQIQLGFPSFTSVFPNVKAGKLKAFAITTKKRSALAPEIPTMDEAGVPGYEASIWNGILAPTGTPKAVVNRLHETIVQILKSPQAAERYANVGAEIRYNSPEEFAVLIRAELAKWAKVIKAAGIRVDER
ncbi:MAG TPA: tripartite tricarboxylate transporter substrate binding protein [Burkholderiales bacterium]|nr:tripartite tricarboxylate transporter substrate binding protein [Burkholderiales bacterium]